MEILSDSKGLRVDSQRTICEEHRTIADLLVCRLKDRPEVIAEILPHVNEAYLMGIRLVAAMIDRKLALPDWQLNNVAEAMALRQERTRLVKELNEAGSCL